MTPFSCDMCGKNRCCGKRWSKIIWYSDFAVHLKTVHWQGHTNRTWSVISSMWSIELVRNSTFRLSRKWLDRWIGGVGRVIPFFLSHFFLRCRIIIILLITYYHLFPCFINLFLNFVWFYNSASGNKGGVAINVNLNGTRLCFVNCHLNAHMEQVLFFLKHLVCSLWYQISLLSCDINFLSFTWLEM